MHRAVVGRFGRLDVLVNNAGIAEAAPGELDHLNEVATSIMGEMARDGHATTRWDAFVSVTDASFAKMVAVHTAGTFFNIRAAIPGMRAASGGAIVNISSASAVVGVPGNPHYAAAKAGILGLTRNAAGELGSDNIRVNAVCPGLIDTDAQRAGLSDAMRAVLAGQAPLRRVGRPEEIAAAVAFLASDDASYLTGQTLHVNGGIYM
jgi:3-oxoacyl-[acyl-carrier protein] reductase